MKSLLLSLICVLLITTARAQLLDKDTVNNVLLIREGQKNGSAFNTGTAQDVLANYLQVAAKNITSKDNGFQLKLNWFALNGMDSATKYDNANFFRTAWQRNGEFVAAVTLEKGSEVKSGQAGFNFNFLNRRDSSMVSFQNVYVKPFAEQSNILLAAVAQAEPAVTAQIEPVIDTLFVQLYQKGATISDLKSLLVTKLPGVLENVTAADGLINAIEAQLNKDISAKKGLSPTIAGLRNTLAKQLALEVVEKPLNSYIQSHGKIPLAGQKYFSDAQVHQLITFIDGQVAANPYLNGKLKATTLNDLNKKVLSDYRSLVKFVSRQPLLTAGYLYTYGKGTALSSHVGSVNFLYGTGNLTTEKEGQIKASLTDTLNSTDPTGAIRNFKRNIISLQVGYNQVLAMQKSVSIMEINGALEYNQATHGYFSGTDKSKFYLDAYFRARLPSTPWLKFDLKWNPGGKVLGFFDFTYNLDKP